MKSPSTYKMLYLLNILSKQNCTKNEIVRKFKQINIPITKTLINHYVNHFIENGINIETKINKSREKVYILKNSEIKIEIMPDELCVISDVKKLLLTQKSYDRIRKTMRLFYKISNYIKDRETVAEFVNFGYFSTINWGLVSQLEKHCDENDVISIDYIMPKGGNRHIDVHVADLRIGEWSQRLYLRCVLDGAKEFSSLPVDRIYMVKKVLKNNQRFDYVADVLNYVVSKKTFDKAKPDSKEKVVRFEGDKVVLERIVEDDFYTIQRLLYFCPDVYSISDSRIKRMFLEKLEIMKSVYDDSGY